jgi:uncharacterized damage-inducible protein DinB
MAKKEFEHTAIDHLSSTPEVLRLVMAGLSEEQTRWKPAADRWSVAEILEHLSHVEGHYFRAALDTILCGDEALIEPYDQEAYAAKGTYAGREPEESFAHWEEQREDNVELMRTTFEAEALKRTAKHPVLGSFTAEDLLNEWALHDLGHVRQILELVRAVMYYPKLGPFQAQYKVAP